VYYTYILLSLKSHIFYYGYSSDLRKRFTEHNDGFVIATKPHIPWKLVWYCAFETEKQAKNFEKYLKSGSGKAFSYKRLISEALAKDVLHRFKGIPKPSVT
jgi:predicted GIY-YIG superfamily endonuclease